MRNRRCIPRFGIPEEVDTATYGFIALGDAARVLCFTNEQISLYNEGRCTEPVPGLTATATATMHLRQGGYCPSQGR